MEPISKFRRRISAPIGEWLNSGGFEQVAIGLGCLFLIAVSTTAILLVANDLFGLGISVVRPAVRTRTPITLAGQSPLAKRAQFPAAICDSSARQTGRGRRRPPQSRG